MKNKSLLRSHPSAQKKIDPENEEIKKFLLGAEYQSKEKENQFLSEEDKFSKQKFPWEDDHTRDDLHKVFNLRLSERYFKKLDYLSEITKISKQKIIQEILLPEVDKRIKKIISSMI